MTIQAPSQTSTKFSTSMQSLPTVYIHRIAINPDFRGNNFVACIIEWAEQYARENAKEYIRMDTIGENRGLLDSDTEFRTVPYFLEEF